MIVLDLHDQTVFILPDGGVLGGVLPVRAVALFGGAAVLVVGQREVDLAVDRVGLEIFRAVHLGGADLVGGQAGVDADLLRGEPVDVRFGGTVLLDGEQRVPGADAVEGAVFGQLAGPVDLRGGGVALQGSDVEGAGVEDAHVVGFVALDDLLVGDELVDVLEALVVPGVADHGAVVGDVDAAGLMLETPQGGVLDRGGFRIEGVDLDDVAEPQELVGFFGHVEAVVQTLPLAF